MFKIYRIKCYNISYNMQNKGNDVTEAIKPIIVMFGTYVKEQVNAERKEN